MFPFSLEFSSFLTVPHLISEHIYVLVYVYIKIS